MPKNPPAVPAAKSLIEGGRTPISPVVVDDKIVVVEDVACTCVLDCILHSDVVVAAAAAALVLLIVDVELSMSPSSSPSWTSI